MSKLSTHVLDLSSGKPAAGVAVGLFRLQNGQRSLLKTTQTNADGRCDSPLLDASEMQTGVYELDFDVGDYFRAQGQKLSEPAFLDIVTLRFGIADSSQNYHVPLLVSPWAYSTYRGS